MPEAVDQECASACLSSMSPAMPWHPVRGWAEWASSGGSAWHLALELENAVAILQIKDVFGGEAETRGKGSRI